MNTARRLPASITVWALLSWVFLVLPLMSLAIEMPMLLSARATMSYAARAAMQAAWTACMDYDGYERTGTVRIQTGCPVPAAQALFAEYTAAHPVALARTATVDRVRLAPGATDRLEMRTCFPHRAIFLGVFGPRAAQQVCIEESVGLHMRQRP
ncbi:MAG: hypothetical protein OXC13_16835 [Caldilineaceae bacterium]|nr:hypothetical protein [Caldilineaceae bacterium]